MQAPNGNSILPGASWGGKTLISKKRVLCAGDTLWDLTWDDGTTEEFAGQFRFYGAR